MTRISLFIFILLSYFSASSNAAGQPSKIVSLAPSITQSLYALGAENRVTGITVYCPRGTTNKETVGTLWEPNIEKIVSLSPDLVLVTKEGNKKEIVGKLERLGIRVGIIESDSSFNDICSNFMAIGRFAGKEREAAGIILQAKERIKKVQDRIKGTRPARVFWEVGARPLFTVTEKSFISDLGSCAGAQNVFSGLRQRYARISREEVIKRDPDVILLVPMGDVSGNEREYWRQFRNLAAVRENRVYVVDAAEIFTPTPMTFAQGVEIVAKLLYPSVFK